MELEQTAGAQLKKASANARCLGFVSCYCFVGVLDFGNLCLFLLKICYVFFHYSQAPLRKVSELSFKQSLSFRLLTIFLLFREALFGINH